MADLLSHEPGASLLEEVENGEYLGIGIVGDHECHHLAFTQEDVDWQAWFDTGDEPALRKLVITYKNLPGEPQYTMMTQSTGALAADTAGLFDFTPPEGANRIQVRPQASGN